MLKRGVSSCEPQLTPPELRVESASSKCRVAINIVSESPDGTVCENDTGLVNPAELNVVKPFVSTGSAATNHGLASVKVCACPYVISTGPSAYSCGNIKGIE